LIQILTTYLQPLHFLVQWQQAGNCHHTRIIMTAIQEMTRRVSEISALIKELETEKSDLIGQLSVAWSVGDLDDYLDEKGNAVVEDVKLERRARTTWSYSPAVKALQEREQHLGIADRKITTYVCVSHVKQK
jgi:hypothetical protein